MALPPIFSMLNSGRHSSYYSSDPEDYYLPHDNGYSYPIPAYPPPPQYPYPYPSPTNYGYIPEYHNPTIPRFRPHYDGNSGGGCAGFLIGFLFAFALIAFYKIDLQSSPESYKSRETYYNNDREEGSFIEEGYRLDEGGKPKRKRKRTR